MNTNPTPAANAVPAHPEPCDLHPERPAVRTRTGLTTPSDPGAARVVVLHYCAECAAEHDYYEALAAEDDEDDEDDSAALPDAEQPLTSERHAELQAAKDAAKAVPAPAPREATPAWKHRPYAILPIYNVNIADGANKRCLGNVHAVWGDDDQQMVELWKSGDRFRLLFSSGTMGHVPGDRREMKHDQTFARLGEWEYVTAVKLADLATLAQTHGLPKSVPGYVYK